MDISYEIYASPLLLRVTFDEADEGTDRGRFARRLWDSNSLMPITVLDVLQSVVSSLQADELAIELTCCAERFEEVDRIVPREDSSCRWAFVSTVALPQNVDNRRKSLGILRFRNIVSF